MIAKIIIIAVIFTVGGFLFYPETQSMFFSTTADALKLNLDEDAVDKVSEQIDEGVDSVSAQIDNLDPVDYLTNQGVRLLDSEQIYYGQVIEKNENDGICTISVPEMAQTINDSTELTHMISVNDCQFEEGESVKVTQKHSQSLNSIAQNPKSTVTVESVSPSQIFKTLSLTSTKTENDDVSISYEDTSGQTISVKVVLRNSEKELFSGEFFSSKFETFVNDVSNSDHVIEMIVEHAEYGTITSSVFSPADNKENTINGVFIK